MATSQFNAWARRYAGVIAVTGLVVAVVGVIASVLGVRAAYDIAQRSGAFAKGDPRLVLGGVEINTTEPTQVYYVVDFDAAGVVICPLVFGVANVGDRSLRDVSLTFRAPAFHVIPTAILRTEILARKAFPKQPGRITTTMGPFTYVTYTIPDIAPKDMFQFSDLIRCKENAFSDDNRIRVVAKRDGFAMEVEYEFLLSLHASEQKTADYKVRFLFVQRDAKVPGMAAALKTAQRHAVYRRNETSALRYLAGWLSGAKERLFVVEPTMELISIEDKTLLAPIDRTTISTRVISLFDIWLLPRWR